MSETFSRYLGICFQILCQRWQGELFKGNNTVAKQHVNLPMQLRPWPQISVTIAPTNQSKSRHVDRVKFLRPSPQILQMVRAAPAHLAQHLIPVLNAEYRHRRIVK